MNDGGANEPTPIVHHGTIYLTNTSNTLQALDGGTGELPGATYEEILFEGYGPGGVALLVDVCDAFPLLVQITLVPTLTLRFAGEKA